MPRIIYGVILLAMFITSFNMLSLVLHDNDVLSRSTIVSSTSSHSNSVDEDFKLLKKPRRKFHVALTANEALYSQWQSRVVYYSYRKVKDLPRSDMGAFTRILHSNKADHLMDEIPTFIVNPLPNGQDRGYTPMNRAWAFVQWLEMASFDEEYVLMIEPDHIFLKPLPNLAFGEIPAAYPFVYVTPLKHEAVIRKFFPPEKGSITDVDPTGSSPVIMKKDMLRTISSTWINLAMRMKDDPDCEKAFGWVSEMYAYAVASAFHGVRHILHGDFMVEPPEDTEIGKAYILHYTYGMDYTLTGERMYDKFGEWRFDKRSYTTSPPPRNLSLPPAGVPETVVRLIEMLNEASASLPNWDGWTEMQEPDRSNDVN